MYCKHCGSNNNNQASVCTNCGQPLSEVGNRNDSIYNSTVLLRQGYSKSSCAGRVFAIILSIIFGIIEFVLLILKDDIFKKNEWFKSNSDIVSVALIVLLVADITVIVLNLIKVSNLKKTFVCVTYIGVYGRGCSNLFFKSKPFTLYYNQITKIIFNDYVIIESGGETYKCDIGKVIDVVGKISISLIKYYKNRGGYVWICNKCGSVNTYCGDTCNSCGYMNKSTNQNGVKEILKKDISLTASRCRNKDEFIKAMAVIGYSVEWNEEVNEVFFICKNGIKLSSSSLGDSRYLLENIESSFVK